MVNLKGQGATEYLVLFAVVLIIAMVVIALLGFFPSVGTGGKQSASDSYWQSARPVQVSSQTVAATGDIKLVLQNGETSSVKITGVSLASAYGSGPIISGDAFVTQLGVGESGNITLAAWVPVANRCTAPNSYEYYLGFSYTENGNSYKFNGTKPIIGKCY